MRGALAVLTCALGAFALACVGKAPAVAPDPIAAGELHASSGLGTGSSGGERPLLEQLAELQRVDGRWSVELGPVQRAHGTACPCAAPERALDDTGLTALLLLIHLEGGQTSRVGPQRAQVALGLRFLRRSQERDSGRIGAGALVGRAYDHALATAVLGEALHLDGDPELEDSFLLALRALEAARTPEGVWSASIEGSGAPTCS